MRKVIQTIKGVAGVMIILFLTGCVIAGRVDSINANTQALTSRSAVQNTDGQENTLNALRDIAGGGAVTPTTTVTP